MLSDLEFRLRARVESDSPEAIILNYLNSRTTLYPPKDMAMIALISYWLPLAHRDAKSLSDQNLEQVIRDSIYRIKLHLQYLQEMLVEKTPYQEVGLIEAKQLENKLNGSNGSQPQVTRAEASPNALPKENSARSEVTQPQQQEWFNPLTSRSKG